MEPDPDRSGPPAAVLEGQARARRLKKSRRSNRSAAGASVTGTSVAGVSVASSQANSQTATVATGTSSSINADSHTFPSRAEARDATTRDVFDLINEVDIEQHDGDQLSLVRNPPIEAVPITTLEASPSRSDEISGAPAVATPNTGRPLDLAQHNTQNNTFHETKHHSESNTQNTYYTFNWYGGGDGPPGGGGRGGGRGRWLPGWLPCGPCALICLILLIILLFAAVYGIATFWNNSIAWVQGIYSGLIYILTLGIFSQSPPDSPRVTIISSTTIDVTPNHIIPAPSGIYSAFYDLGFWMADLERLNAEADGADLELFFTRIQDLSVDVAGDLNDRWVIVANDIGVMEKRIGEAFGPLDQDLARILFDLERHPAATRWQQQQDNSSLWQKLVDMMPWRRNKTTAEILRTDYDRAKSLSAAARTSRDSFSGAEVEGIRKAVTVVKDGSCKVGNLVKTSGHQVSEEDAVADERRVKRLEKLLIQLQELENMEEIEGRILGLQLSKEPKDKEDVRKKEVRMAKWMGKIAEPPIYRAGLQWLTEISPTPSSCEYFTPLSVRSRQPRPADHASRRAELSLDFADVRPISDAGQAFKIEMDFFFVPASPILDTLHARSAGVGIPLILQPKPQQPDVAVMGFLEGDCDAQRSFNGVFFEHLILDSSKRMIWRAEDRTKMLAWLAQNRHSKATLGRNQASLSKLADSVGLDLRVLSQAHRCKAKDKMLRSLTYQLDGLVKKKKVTEYWDTATRTAMLRWPEELVRELTVGISETIHGIVQETMQQEEESPEPVVILDDDDRDFRDYEGDITMGNVCEMMDQTGLGQTPQGAGTFSQRDTEEAMRRSLGDQNPPAQFFPPPAAGLPHGQPAAQACYALHQQFPGGPAIAQTRGPSMSQTFNQPTQTFCPVSQALDPAVHQTINHPAPQSLNHFTSQAFGSPASQEFGPQESQAFNQQVPHQFSPPQSQNVCPPTTQEFGSRVSEAFDAPSLQSVSQSAPRQFGHPEPQNAPRPLASPSFGPRRPQPSGHDPMSLDHRPAINPESQRILQNQRCLDQQLRDADDQLQRRVQEVKEKEKELHQRELEAVENLVKANKEKQILEQKLQSMRKDYQEEVKETERLKDENRQQRERELQNVNPTPRPATGQDFLFDDWTLLDPAANPNQDLLASVTRMSASAAVRGSLFDMTSVALHRDEHQHRSPDLPLNEGPVPSTPLVPRPASGCGQNTFRVPDGDIDSESERASQDTPCPAPRRPYQALGLYLPNVQGPDTQSITNNGFRNELDSRPSELPSTSANTRPSLAGIYDQDWAKHGGARRPLQGPSSRPRSGASSDLIEFGPSPDDNAPRPQGVDRHEVTPPAIPWNTHPVHSPKMSRSAQLITGRKNSPPSAPLDARHEFRPSGWQSPPLSERYDSETESETDQLSESDDEEAASNPDDGDEPGLFRPDVERQSTVGLVLAPLDYDALHQRTEKMHQLVAVAIRGIWWRNQPEGDEREEHLDELDNELEGIDDLLCPRSATLHRMVAKYLSNDE
ncbi:hypothetical protein NM208_g10667 [Fusarium decemcellulare]|uniref:Uncharacterized protein n=1 Tax=Fusarium decemcellulare TaxID=57161 RepID=A0ACC1RX60_9HYPO|nr:hypothetical protein NM208_g10667 [Fusarium decemcellulare]